MKAPHYLVKVNPTARWRRFLQSWLRPEKDHVLKVTSNPQTQRYTCFGMSLPSAQSQVAPGPYRGATIRRARGIRNMPDVKLTFEARARICRS